MRAGSVIARSFLLKQISSWIGFLVLDFQVIDLGFFATQNHEGGAGGGGQQFLVDISLARQADQRAPIGAHLYGNGQFGPHGDGF